MTDGHEVLNIGAFHHAGDDVVPSRPTPGFTRTGSGPGMVLRPHGTGVPDFTPAIGRAMSDPTVSAGAP